MSYAIWIELAAFGVGLLLGSFLNVCIARLPEHRSIVQPGSACMVCGHAIRWYDNVPVLSWLALRGRCRDCGAGISWRYPAVELGVGLWFLYFAWKFVAFGKSSEWTDFQRPGPYV
jgi:leader peptidase (prepilin peptidase)/N-methyltransferase